VLQNRPGRAPYSIGTSWSDPRAPQHSGGPSGYSVRRFLYGQIDQPPGNAFCVLWHVIGGTNASPTKPTEDQLSEKLRAGPVHAGMGKLGPVKGQQSGCCVNKGGHNPRQRSLRKACSWPEVCLWMSGSRDPTLEAYKLLRTLSMGQV
jgi:hypothetical protein